jgi:hypothetical protein
MLQMTYDQREIYSMGEREALKFRADPYRDLYQDVFKAETADYRLWVGYNDPDGCATLTVELRGESRRHRKIEIEFADPRQAIERATRFVYQHPAPRPRCHVDY